MDVNWRGGDADHQPGDLAAGDHDFALGHAGAEATAYWRPNVPR